MARNPCARCGAEAHDLFICEQCGEMVCANCLAETGTDQTICEDCPTKLSEVERLRGEKAVLQKFFRLSTNGTMGCACRRCVEQETNKLKQALAGQAEKERDEAKHHAKFKSANLPCGNALDKIWTHVFPPASKYGDWEYPGFAFRHITAEFDALKAKLLAAEKDAKRLREALRLHKHTAECLHYAAKTSRASNGIYNCIAKCADSHRQALAGNAENEEAE